VAFRTDKAVPDARRQTPDATERRAAALPRPGEPPAFHWRLSPGVWRLASAALLIAILFLAATPPLRHRLRGLSARAAAVADERLAASSPVLLVWLNRMGEPHTDAGVKARDALTRRGAAVVPRLLDRLTHPSPQTRAAAALVLGNIRDPRALEPLCAALRDPEPQVRFRAVYALGRLKDPRAVPSLAPLLSDPAPDVLQVTLRALEECRCKVRPRTSGPGYEILPQAATEWQVIALHDNGPS
jgi:hypothetical protein